MDLESYLVEEKPQIMAIARISQIIEQSISENYYDILNGKISKSYLDNIEALVNAIQMIAYAMRCCRRECYTKFNADYKDDFTFASVVFEDL